MAEKTASESHVGIFAGIAVVLLIIACLYFFQVKKASSPSVVNLDQEEKLLEPVSSIADLKAQGKFGRDLLHDPFMMQISMNEGGLNVEMTYVKKGDQFYLAVPALGIKTITTADRTCQINDAAQTYTCETTATSDATLLTDADLEMLAQAPVLGSADVDGVTYETETYNNSVVAYYNGEVLSFYRNSDDPTLVKVLQYQPTADDNLFVIPATYTEAAAKTNSGTAIDLSQIEGMQEIDPALLEQMQEQL